MTYTIEMDYGPNQGANIMKHCLNCNIQLHKDSDIDFCNADCEEEYFSQEDYVCGCEPDVDELQENQDFAQDNMEYPDGE